MKDNYQVKLKCVFCGGESFNIPKGEYKPKPGEQIKCACCGKMNDYESLHQIAFNKGINTIKKDFNNEIKKTLKKSNLTIKISI